MEGAKSKLVIKRQGANLIPASELELQIGKALSDLQNSGNEVAAELRMVQIYSAKEIELGEGRRALVLRVPVPQLKIWRKIQVRVARELEKKLTGSSNEQRLIIIIAHRRIIRNKSKSGRGSPVGF